MGGDRNPTEHALRYCEQAASEVDSGRRTLETACVLVGGLHLKATVGRETLDAHDIGRMRAALKRVKTDGQALLEKLTETEAALDKADAVGDPNVPRYQDLGAVLSHSTYAESASRSLVSHLDGLRLFLIANEMRAETVLAEKLHPGPADPVSLLDVRKLRVDIAAMAAQVTEAQRLLREVEQKIAPLTPAPDAAVN